MDDLNVDQLIDQLLDQARPDRYDARDKSWLDPIIAEVAHLIPTGEAKAIAAADKVRWRETSATRTANAFLREIGSTGQMPLDWMDLGRRPVAWDEHRVCLVECSPADFRDWAVVERRRAANDFAARNAACEGAEWLADKLDADGRRRLGDLGDDG